MIAVADSGPLIALAKIGLLYLLPQIYKHVLVPSPVFDEAVRRGHAGGHVDAHALDAAIADGSLSVVDTSNDRIDPMLASLPLGTGEQHAIHLARQRSAAWVLLDDRLARQAAAAWGIPVKGTVGVIAHACQADMLQRRERDEIFAALLGRTDVWLNRRLVERVWDELRKAD